MGQSLMTITIPKIIKKMRKLEGVTQRLNLLDRIWCKAQSAHRMCVIRELRIFYKKNQDIEALDSFYLENKEIWHQRQQRWARL